MLRLLVRPLALVLALAFGITSADAAQRRAKPEPPPPPPPQFKVEGPTRPMAMERLVLSAPSNAKIGRFVESTFCTDTNATPALKDGPAVDLTLSHAFPGAPASDFTDVFAAEAAAAGYALAGAQSSSDLFSSADEKRPELIVGAAIVDIKANGCIGAFRGITVTTTITVDWQVFDPLEKKLVFRKKAEATRTLFKDLALETAVPSGALESFRQVSKDILADPEFVTALRRSDAAAVMQPVNPIMVQIPRVALRTAPFKDQIPDLRRQVVTILTGNSSGSGFYIADGMIMTNHHVIVGSTNVKVRFYGGREIPGEVIISDHRRDIAIVKTIGGGTVGLPIQFERPQVGAQVYVVGSPLGEKQEGTVTAGLVSAYRDREGFPFMQSDVAINSGNSGGPMFDDKGNVVAVVVSGFGETDSGLNFFIPIDDAFRVLRLGVAGIDRPMAAQQQVAVAGGRAIQVSMYPAAGPFQKSGKTQAITGSVGGVGGAGTFAFTRPDGVTCDGKWTTLQSKPASGSLLDKHRDVVGIGADPAGMVGGLAMGACSNGGSFQAEYYVVPTADSGFGAATDSDGNIYKVIF